MAVGLLCGVGADLLVGDPVRRHPVAGFGALCLQLERALWRPARTAGAVYLVAAVTPLVVTATALDRWLRGRPLARAAYVAVLTWTVVGATNLRRTALGIAASGEDLGATRRRLPALCGRDPDRLDATGLRRAVIESVGENTSDAAVAPLVWGALAGPVGLVGYRAVNTLDAMVGHRSERYEQFGWAAARLDDLANLVPARVTAALVGVLAPTVGGRSGEVLTAWRRGAPAHPSPNAGPCEAAFAGALGVRLGGPTIYSYGESARPRLGAGRDPQPGDVERAVALSRRVVAAATLLCALARLTGGALARLTMGAAARMTVGAASRLVGGSR